MKKAISVVILLLCILNAGAYYDSLVREDRIWEYYNVSSSDDTYQRVYLRFKGNSEANGNTYNNLIRIRITKDHPWGKDPRNDTTCVAKMRENDKRIYILKTDGDSVYEELLYDFSVKEVGDTVRLYTENALNGQQRHSYFVVSKLYGDPFYIKSCGRKYNAYRTDLNKTNLNYYDDKRLNRSYLYIEGVGIGYVNYYNYNSLGKNRVGYLHYPDYTDGVGVASGEGLKLVCVYDGKWRKIFDPLDIGSGSDGVEDINGTSSMTIQENKDCIKVSSETKLKVTIYSMQGSKVAGAEGAGEVSVSTSGLVPGVYVVRAVSADGRSATRKVVVK